MYTITEYVSGKINLVFRYRNFLRNFLKILAGAVCALVLALFFENSKNVQVRGHSCSTFATFFEKLTFLTPLIRTRRCAYFLLKKISFEESFACVLNEWPLTVSQAKKYYVLRKFWKAGLYFVNLSTSFYKNYSRRWRFPRK